MVGIARPELTKLSRTDGFVIPRMAGSARADMAERFRIDGQVIRVAGTAQSELA